MAYTPDRGEFPGRLRRLQEELIATKRQLVASRLRQLELLDQTRELLARTRTERNNLRSIVHSIVEEVWYCDSHMFVAPMNPSAQALLRFGRMEDGRMPLHKWLARLEPRGEDGSPLTPEQTPLLRSLHGETVQEFRELVYVPFTSRLLVREVNSSPVTDEEGRIVGAVAVVRNIA